VDYLATDQAIIIFMEVTKTQLFLQCDHASDGCLAKVLKCFDLKDKTKAMDGSIQQVLLGVDVTGKQKSSEIAEAINHACN